MGERTELIKQFLFSAFPKLRDDADFKITSKETYAYNCIAWAYGYDDRWMWPKTGKDELLDGICYWPIDVIQEASIGNFIKAFHQKGYECCDNGDFEDKYQKIALYAKPDSWDICTHASLQKRNGCWSSKLGPSCDIQHGTPYSIENNDYGKVRCFMKRLFV